MTESDAYEPTMHKHRWSQKTHGSQVTLFTSLMIHIFLSWSEGTIVVKLTLEETYISLSFSCPRSPHFSLEAVYFLALSYSLSAKLTQRQHEVYVFHIMMSVYLLSAM